MISKAEYFFVKVLLYQILAYTINAKISKSQIRTINSKYQLVRHGMKTFSYLMGHIIYQIFNLILSIYLKKVKKRFIIQ